MTIAGMPGIRFVGPLLLAAALQQTPVFRGGVDLVTVDVVVLDASGAPVSDLTAADFAVEAGGVARRIVSAEYVDARRAARTLSATAPSAPASSSNTRQPPRRTLLFVRESGQWKLAHMHASTALAEEP